MRSPDPKLTLLLRSVPGVSSLSEPAQDELVELVDDYEVPEGTVLMRQGASGQSSYVVVAGWASIVVDGTAVAAIGPGRYIGERAIVEEQPRTATVTAKTALRVLVVGPEAMKVLLDHPLASDAIRAGLVRQLSELEAS